MQDKDGNTALHLAIQGQATCLLIFCALFGNREVHLNLTNHNGHTPLDQSRSMLPRGTEELINQALEQVGSQHRQDRWDHIQEIYDRSVVSPEDQAKEPENVKDLTQTSVLIATVTFGAMFAPPGGYRADDHPDGGTPILARSYIFYAFMMANTLASLHLLFDSYHRSPVFNLGTRGDNFLIIAFLMNNSVTCLTTAFALGAYMVLPPVDNKIAVVQSVS
uniref:PGG domain-containing protein n=1 Tax=Oryza punctata TaxID=4537 RepID=A0A0E0MLE1_ORYPU